MPRTKKLFYYNMSDRDDHLDVFVDLVSEIKLPRPTKKFLRCAFEFSKGVRRRIRYGVPVDLVYGDPIILRRCVRIPLRVKQMSNFLRRKWKRDIADLMVFRYRGKKFWVDADCICRLKDMQNS